jgi:hypothetical protein
MSDRPGDVSDKVRIELAPIAASLRADIVLDEHGWDLVVRALAHAMMVGVRIGGAEVAAQAIEKGLPVVLNMQVDASDPGEDR